MKKWVLLRTSDALNHKFHIKNDNCCLGFGNRKFQVYSIVKNIVDLLVIIITVPFFPVLMFYCRVTIILFATYINIYFLHLSRLLDINFPILNQMEYFKVISISWTHY